jgi:hypothetical protein
MGSEEKTAKDPADDLAFQIFALRAHEMQDLIMAHEPRPGLESRMASVRRFKPFINLFQGFLIFILIFTPPTWCQKIRNQVDHDCRRSTTNNIIYLRSVIPFFTHPLFIWLTQAILMTLTGIRLFRYSLLYPNQAEWRKPFNFSKIKTLIGVLIGLMAISGLLFINELSQALGYWMIWDKVMLLWYLAIYNRYLRKNLARILFIIVDSLPMLAAYWLFLIFCAALSRILYYDAGFPL